MEYFFQIYLTIDSIIESYITILSLYEILTENIWSRDQIVLVSHVYRLKKFCWRRLKDVSHKIAVFWLKGNLTEILVKSSLYPRYVYMIEIHVSSRTRTVLIYKSQYKFGNIFPKTKYICNLGFTVNQWLIWSIYFV